MLKIKGYQSIKTDHQSELTRIYRAVKDDDTPVIFKTSSSELPLVHVLNNLQREATLLEALKGEGIPELVEVVEQGARLILVMEDTGATPLTEYLPIDVTTFLDVAIKITKTLKRAHDQGIIHRDVNPRNIVYNPDTGDVQLIDFGIAQYLEVLAQREVFELEGTLPYLAPCASGRLLFHPDIRADIYSLGVTFYEMLLGQRPFEEPDAMAWIHAHIAKTPPQLKDQLTSYLPDMLNTIIMRMINKAPEDRYQSADSLLYDLQKCQAQWVMNGDIESFEPGDIEAFMELHEVDSLFEREDALETIQSHLPGGFVLVQGVEGLGKSALLQHLHDSITSESVLSFVIDCEDTGVEAFDVLNIIINETIDHLLQGAEHILDELSVQMKGMFDEDEQILITHYIPAFKHVWGEQPELHDDDIQENILRQQDYYFRILKAFGGHFEVCVCLDNVHDIDPPSMNVLQDLLASPDSGKLSIIGSSHHSPEELVNDVQMQHLVHIKLKPLSTQGVRNLVSRILYGDVENYDRFIKALIRKTKGNPSFIQVLLNHLFDQHSLKYSIESECWQWNAKAIQKVPLQGGVVALLTARTSGFSDNQKNQLAAVSCIGDVFNQDLVNLLLDVHPEPIFYDKLLKEELVEELENGSYEFAHPGLPEQFAKWMSTDETQYYSFKLARIIIDGKWPESFELETKAKLAYFDNAIQLLSTEEMTFYIDMLSEYALKTFSMLKYADAAKYYMEIYRLFNEYISHDPTQSFEHGVDLLQSLYAAGEHEAAIKLVPELLERSDDNFDRARIIKTCMALRSQQGDLATVIELAYQAMDLLEMPLPKSEADIGAAIGRGMQILQTTVKEKGTKWLAELPVITNERYEISLEVLMQLTPAAFQLAPPLFVAITLQNFEISTIHGVSHVSAYCYASCGILLANSLNDIDNAVAIGQAATDVIERFAPHVTETGVGFINGSFLQHLKMSINTFQNTLEQTYEKGELLGDIEHAAYAIAANALNWTSHGLPLPKAVIYTSKSLVYAEKVQSVPNILNLKLSKLLIKHLMMPAGNESELVQETSAFLASQESVSIMSTFCWRHTGLMHFWNDDYDKAWQDFEKVSKHVALFQGMSTGFDYFFFHALTGLLHIQNLPEKEHQAIFKAISSSVELVSLYAEHNPGVYGIYKLMLDAEFGRYYGDSWAMIVNNYTHVAEHRSKNELHIRGLAMERLASFWESVGQHRMIKQFIFEAHAFYQRWGAAVKANALQLQYPEVFVTARSSSTQTATHHTQTHHTHHTQTHHTATSSTSGYNESLDIDSVIKATQALGTETKVDKLFETLMKTITENIGAQQISLLLLEGKQWQVAARSTGDGDTVIEDVPLNDVDDLPTNILTLAMRTGESLVLKDAQQSRFAKNKHIKKNRVRSVVCVPILQRKKVIGILYAENNGMASAFSDKHVKLAGIIASQTATSLENIKIFEQLEERVAVRTRELNQRNRETQALLDRLPQGIFTLDENLCIEPGYSKHLGLLLGTDEDLSGQCITDTLFRHTSLSDEEVAMSQMALQFGYGGPVFMTEVNWEHLVRAFDRCPPCGTPRSFEVDWTPIEDEFDDVVRVLVTLRDVTEIKKLEQAAQQHARGITMLQEILTAGVSDFQEFAKNTALRIEENRNLLRARNTPNKDDVQLMFRNLHTIKGNARVLGLAIISNETHTVEEPVQEIRQNPESITEYTSHTLEQGLDSLAKTLEDHVTIFNEKLGSVINTSSSDDAKVQQVRDLVEQALHQSSSKSPALEQAKFLLDNMDAISLEEVVHSVARMFPSLSQELDKPVPHVEIEHGDVMFPHEFSTVLNDVLVHIFRNSFDHGIEPVEDRISAQKAEEGTISVYIKENEKDAKCLFVQDDGRGLALQSLRKKFGEDMSDIEVANNIFKSGVSSAQQVTSISGRGVGMDVVRAFLKQHGCLIDIVFTGPEARGYRPFALRIQLSPKVILTSTTTNLKAVNIAS